MNRINILKLTADNVSLFSHNHFELDFTNKIQVTNYNFDHPFYNVFSRLFLPKYIAFNGVNSSGKTTIVEMISFFIFYHINLLSIESRECIKILDKFHIGKDMVFTMYFELKGKIYKVITTIGTPSEKYDVLGLGFPFEVKNEEVYIKDINSRTPRKLLFEEDFKLVHSYATLNEKEQRLIKGKNTSLLLITGFASTFGTSLCEMNTQNDQVDAFGYLNAKNLPIIQYLDPSIRTIKDSAREIKRKNETIITKTLIVEFENNTKYELSPQELYSILSSGTKRALKILNDVRKVLRLGGYYLIDELELSLNRSIVNDIINLFESNKTNPYNATLIFTTHYVELVDSFDRNDQIFFVHRDHDYGIEITNYSDVDRKNQLKKSESFFADTHNLGTAIEYKKYLNMRDSFTLSED